VSRTFYLTPHRLVFPVRTTVSSVHCIAVIIIRRSFFCTLRVTFCRFNIVSIAFCPVINAVIITNFVRNYNCTNTLGILCNASVQAIHNGCEKVTLARWRRISRIQIARYSQTNAIRHTKTTPRASKEQSRQLLRSTSAYFSQFKETNKQIRMHLRDQRRNNLATGVAVTSNILAFLRRTAEDLGKSPSG